MVLRDRNVIITGAGGGIGAQIALAFAAKGANAALVDRDPDALERAAAACREKGVRVVCIATDITGEDGIEKIVGVTGTRLGQIDVLVNNAGVMVFKSVGAHTREDVYNTLMVNVFGAIRLTQAVMKGMVERGSGRIVNIGSIFGSLSYPYFSIYSASKSAIRGFSEGLRRELDSTGVGVTYVAPRATRTSQSDAFFEMAGRMKMNLDRPEKVASIVAKAVEKEASEVLIGLPESFFVLLNKLAPSIVDRGLRRQAGIMSEYTV